MANVIKIKNSGTANSAPTSLEVGELAINYADGKIYYRNASNAVVEFASAGSGGIPASDTPPSSPVAGDLWYESDTGKTFVYYDSFWVEIGAGSAVEPNSVALGVDTTGGYVASLVAGTGITLSNNSGEGATPTVTVNTSTIATLVSPTFTGAPTLPTGTIATTQTAGNNTTAVATTAFVAAQSALASPIGMITAFAGSTAPTNWLMCDGRSTGILRTTYASLFAVIGTTYGAGDGSTTFNLPDLRGRTIAGLDNMGGTDAGRLSTANNLGTTTGTETVTLATTDIPSHGHTPTVTNNAVNTGNQSADHSHTFSTGTVSADHSHSFNDGRTFYGENPDTDWGFANGSGRGFKVYNQFAATTGGISANHSHSGTTAGMNVSHTHAVTSNVAVTIANTGGGGAHNNMQPTMTINYIILAGA